MRLLIGRSALQVDPFLPPLAKEPRAGCRSRGGTRPETRPINTAMSPRPEARRNTMIETLLRNVRAAIGARRAPPGDVLPGSACPFGQSRCLSNAMTRTSQASPPSPTPHPVVRRLTSLVRSTSDARRSRPRQVASSSTGASTRSRVSATRLPGRVKAAPSPARPPPFHIPDRAWAPRRGVESGWEERDCGRRTHREWSRMNEPRRCDGGLSISPAHGLPARRRRTGCERNEN